MDANALDFIKIARDVGAFGILAFVVFGLLKGWIVTRREHEAEVRRHESTLAKLEKSISNNERSAAALEGMREIVGVLVNGRSQ